MDKKITMGHITALITIVIWGTTFISTKILLADFTPIEILFFKFLLGLLVLIAVYPKRLRIEVYLRCSGTMWDKLILPA